MSTYCDMCWEENRDSNPCTRCVETSTCQVCNKGDEDPDFYLLCERGFCNTGLHAKCAPELNGIVPEGRWICSACEFGESLKKKAKLQEEEVEGEEKEPEANNTMT